MWDNKDTCQSCRGCCKFRADETYFAPVFTAGEVEQIRAHGKPADGFTPHRGHDDVFQITLVPSALDPTWFVCPYLNEETHLCDIYSVRPTDCRIWPLLMMKDKEGQNTVLGCFHKRLCTRTGHLTEPEFEKHVAGLTAWFDKEDFIRHLRQSPGLAWDYEPDTIHVRTLDLLN
ncbi:MAG: YkgJ family cysteine cluster protein [Fibrobacterota bacterium]